jgi:3-oxoacyl-[acyl-carrier protein] reductase
MDLQLNGKVALITGASRGLGKACAEMFASEGCHLSLCGRN